MEYGNWGQRAAQPSVGFARGACEASSGEALQKKNEIKRNEIQDGHKRKRWCTRYCYIAHQRVLYDMRDCCDVSIVRVKAKFFPTVVCFTVCISGCLRMRDTLQENRDKTKKGYGFKFNATSQYTYVYTLRTIDVPTEEDVIRPRVALFPFAEHSAVAHDQVPKHDEHARHAILP